MSHWYFNKIWHFIQYDWDVLGLLLLLLGSIATQIGHLNVTFHLCDTVKPKDQTWHRSTRITKQMEELQHLGQHPPARLQNTWHHAYTKMKQKRGNEQHWIYVLFLTWFFTIVCHTFIRSFEFRGLRNVHRWIKMKKRKHNGLHSCARSSVDFNWIFPPCLNRWGKWRWHFSAFQMGITRSCELIKISDAHFLFLFLD